MSYLSITHPLNGILMLGMGVGLGIIITRHYKLDWRLWWIGAFTFIISQVGHLPFNYGVLNPLISKLMGSLTEAWHLPMIALLLGLSSGIFEEFTRYAVYRWWAKDARTWSQGLLFGAGHGGLEAILIGGLSLFTFFQLEALKDIDLTTIIPAEQIHLAQQQLGYYWSMPWYESLIGAVERAFTIPLHLAAAMIVLQAMLRGQFRWVWLAVGLHALVNALGVYLSQTSGVYIAELCIGILAIIDIAIIYLLRRSTPISPAEPPPATPMAWPAKPIQEIAETPDNLEQTRYQ